MRKEQEKKNTVDRRVRVTFKRIPLKPVAYFFMIFTILLFSCRKKTEFLSFAGTAQGTTYSIVFEKRGDNDAFKLKEEVEKLLRDFDMSLSLYKDSSILSRINRNEETIPDKYFLEVFKRSSEISRMTAGAFDVTVGPLVRAWGFGPDERRDISREKIDSLLKFVGMTKVKIAGSRIVKSDPAINLDFNAIAQGYSVDIICHHLEESGITNYLVEIGGEVRVRGTREGALWRIGIDRPADNNMSPGTDLEAVIRMTDRSLATSGNYRKFYIKDGIKYSHTIDPRTGYPARNQLLSATILASDCATADGIATACMVMGKEKSIEFLDLHPEFDGYLIYSDENGNFRTWMTQALKEFISESE